MRVQNNDPAHCLNSMGAARLFRYTNINDELLIDLCIAAVGQYIPRFSEEFEDALQIECRAHWIMAMSDLAKRYQQLPDAFFELKNTLIVEFTVLSISGIANAEQCQFVVQLFKEVIQDDLDVAEAIFTAFEIPEDLSPDLQAQLEELQKDITARLKGKHG
jgi:hypothetical protein